MGAARQLAGLLGFALVVLFSPAVAVAAEPVAFTSAAPASPVTAYVAISHTFTAGGGTGPYTYSLVSGALPVGVSLSSAGLLSGTPATPGSYTFTVKVTDAAAGTATQPVTIVVQPPAITFTSGAVPSPVVAYTPVSHMFTAGGGTGPYSYSLVSGALPAGVSFSSAGLLSGTPITPGSYTFTVRVTDAHGFGADKTVTIVITAPVLTFTSGTVPSPWYTGQARTHTFTVTGGASPYTYSLVSGGLPIGVTFSSAGVLSGTPARAGTHTLSIKVTDAHGFTATTPATLVVADPAVVFTSADPPGAVAGQAYSFTFAAAGDSGIVFTLTSGTLPAGLSLAATGALTGTPATAGTSTFTVKAAGTASSATRTVTLTVAAAPAAEPTSVPTTTAPPQLPRTGGTASLAAWLGAGVLAGGVLLLLGAWLWARRTRLRAIP